MWIKRRKQICGSISENSFFAVIATMFTVGEVIFYLVNSQLMSQIVGNSVFGLNNDVIGDLSLIRNVWFKIILLVLFGEFCRSINNVFVHLSGQNIGNEMRKKSCSLLSPKNVHSMCTLYKNKIKIFSIKHLTTSKLYDKINTWTIIHIWKDSGHYGRNLHHYWS